MRISLILKLMAAFLLVITISALVIYFLTTQATQSAFRLYTTQNSQLWSQRLAPVYADYYSRSNSWQGVEVFVQSDLVTEMMPGMMNGSNGQGGNRGRGMGMGGMNQRLILADERGRVIADTGGDLIGGQLSEQELENGSPVQVSEQVVGTIIVTPADMHGGLDNPANTFLTSVNRSIIISVLIASCISLILVLLFSIQITAPIRQMQKVAGAIAKGDLSQRVPVRPGDELGDLAQTFNQMTGSLSAADIQRRKLLADIAHELRTPMTVIQANAEAMQDGVLPLEQAQVNAIHAETLLLARLIDDLRLISLAEAGELHLERKETDLADLLQQAADRIRPQCQQKNITLELHIPGQLPWLHLDGDRIIQVINNLVTNALRYTPTNGTISIQADVVTSGVDVAITDNGTGIAAEDLPAIFDRFYRADKSRARASGGSGLGLAIVKEIVQAHSGRVSAHSPVFEDAGRLFGTRMVIHLPFNSM